MSSIDERVVQMKFDNKQFESGVRTTLAALEALKKGLDFKATSTKFSTSLESLNKDAQNLKKTLNFKDASKSFDDLGNSAKSATSNIDFATVGNKLMSLSEKIQGVKKHFTFSKEANNVADLERTVNKMDLSPMANAIEDIKNRFNNMGIVGITIMQNLTNMAMQTGTSIVKAMSIQSVIDGYREYETQINSVQTILANTKKEGTNIAQVNSALDTLNTYADKTIYNFTEMTRNIGTFTAAGVDLQTSVNSIQGIANLAAVSGSSSLQASTAMYQLSQAIASGTVKLMDWNSVVNAGMGGQVFQDALIRTSEHLHTGAKAAIEAQGSFRESLQTGWLTVDVLTETLKQFSLNVETAEDYEQVMADLVSQGYTEEEAKDIADMARTAMDAATKVKTFTQLIDTLKEELGSGWAMSWRIIIGDFEDAKALWTEVANVLQTAISNSSQLRNDMLKGWADLGGRTTMIEGFKNIFEAIVPILTKVSESFRELFPRTTSQQLYDLTVKFKDFTETLKPSEERLNQISRISKGLFSILSMLKKSVATIIKPIGDFLGSDGMKGLIDGLLEAAACFGDFFSAMNEGAESSGFFTKVTENLSNTLKGLSNPLSVIGEVIKDFAKMITDIAKVISESLGSLFEWLTGNINFSDILTLIASGGIVSVASNIDKLVESIQKFLKNIANKQYTGFIDTLKTSLSSFFKELGASIQAFTMMVNTVSLVAIAGAIALLVHSIKVLTQLDFGLVLANLPVMAILIGTLVKNFKKLVVVIKGLNLKSTIAASLAMVALAESLNLMAKAMQKMADIPFDKILQSLGSVIVVLKAMSVLLRKTDLSKKSLSASATLILISASLVVMSKAIENLANLSVGGAIQGVVAISAALFAMVGALKLIDNLKISPSVPVTLLGISISMVIVAKALKELGSMSLDDEIPNSLSAMAIALTELTVVTAVLDKFSGLKSLVGAASILMLTLALKPIAEALKEFAKISDLSAGRALRIMGIALLELVVVNGILGYFAGLSGVVAAVSVLILVQALQPIADALKEFSSINVDDSQRALEMMGIALLELITIDGILGRFAGLSGIVAAVSVLILVQALQPIADALKEFVSMSWDEIKRGLVAMGGALVELGIVAGLLGGLGGIAALVGAGTILLASQGLEQIANALQKFGSMSWDEIEQGLTAMGIALEQIAVGSLLNTLGIIGSFSIAEVAEPLGVLADSVKKWQDVQVPENLKDQLYALSDGVMAFTLSGFGAGVIADVAEPLGVMAESLRKWQDVQVSDELTDSLKRFANALVDFNLAFIAGFSIGAVVDPLKNLAEAVNQWKDVSIPDDIDDGLTALSEGINAFSLSFAGGFSLGTVTGPLGDLADAVKKWQGVSVPEGIGDQLKSLADAISVFSGAFVTGWSLGSVAGPLGDLADSLHKWEGLTIPTDIQDGLTSLANGVNQFANSGSAMYILNESGGALGVLGEGLQKLSGIDYEGIAGHLTSFSQSIQGLPEQLSSFTTAIGDSIYTIATSIVSQTDSVITAVTDMMNQVVNSLNAQNDAFGQAGSNIAQYFTYEMSQGLLTQGMVVVTAIQQLSQQITEAGLSEFSSYVTDYVTSGSDLLQAFEQGADSRKSEVVSLFQSLASECLTALQSTDNTGFYQAGLNMMLGLQNGIIEGRSGVINAAIKVSTDALTATRDALDEHSPSKATAKMGRYYDQGLINGMEELLHKVRKTSEIVGKEALTGLKNSMSGLEVNTTSFSPVITPVVDASNLRTLSGFNTSKTLTYNARIANAQVISPVRAMQKSFEQERAATVQSNNEVLESLKGLRSDISSYNETLSTMENAMYIDGKKLASSIAKPMNRELGTLSKRGRL